MATEEELVKLALEITGSKDLEEFTKKVIEGKASLDELGKAAEAAGPAAAKIADHVEKPKEGIKALGESASTTLWQVEGMLESIIKGFGSGDFSGAITKCEELAGVLGTLGGPVGIIAAVGAAAYVAYPYVKDYMAALAFGKNEIPGATDALGKLTDQIDKNKDALKKLTDHHTLNNAELVKFGQLTAANLLLEKAVTKEKETQAALDKLRDKGGDEGSAKAFGEVMKGQDVDHVIAQVASGLGSDAMKTGKMAGLEKTYQKQLVALGAEEKSDPFNLTGMYGPMKRDADKTAAAIAAIKAGYPERAREIVAGASEGKADDLVIMQRALGDTDLSRHIGATLPGARAASDEQAAQAGIQSATAEGVYSDRVKAKKEADKETKERHKRWEHRQKVGDDAINQQADQDDADQASRDLGDRQADDATRDVGKREKLAAEKAGREAVRLKAKQARDADPLRQNRAAQRGERDAYLEFTQRNTPGADPRFQALTAKHAQANHQAGVDAWQSIEQAFETAMYQARADMMRGIHVGAQRSRQRTETRIP